MPPPQHEVWTHYTVTVPRRATPKKQHPDVLCKYCGREYKNAQPKKNLVGHIAGCVEAPHDARRKCQHHLDEYDRRDKQLGKRHGFPNSEEVDRTPRKKSRSEEVSFAPAAQEPITIAEKKQFHREIAAAFYSTAIPFRVIENPHFQHILTKYRPGMTLPSRQHLSTTLLDEAYAQEKRDIIEELRDEDNVAVVSNGWSDPNSESIVNFMVTSPFIRPVFWSSVPTRDDRHTGEYMASALIKVIREVEDAIRGSVCAVVTDNASNMVKSWEFVTKELPAVTCNGCSAHTLNLLLKDLFSIDDLKDVLAKAVGIVKFVRKRPALLYRFREKQRHRMNDQRHQRCRVLTIPVSTRWYSKTACISSVASNEGILLELFADDGLMERYKDAVVKLNRVKTTLADGNFWMKARLVLRLTNPIIDALRCLEKDGCCLSMVYHYFRGLYHNDIYYQQTNGMDPTILGKIRAFIHSRWSEIKRESTLAAFLLDPTKPIADFEPGDFENAVNSCVQLAERVGFNPGITARKFHSAVSNFARKKRGWKADKLNKNAKYTPIDWWMYQDKLFKDMRMLAQVKQFAARVLSIPTSSAASERSWSIHSFIHNKRRNRLKPANVEKLAYIYSNSEVKQSASEIHYLDGDAIPSDSDNFEEFDDELPQDSGARRRHDGIGRTRSDTSRQRALFGRTDSRFGDHRSPHAREDDTPRRAPHQLSPASHHCTPRRSPRPAQASHHCAPPQTPLRTFSQQTQQRTPPRSSLRHTPTRSSLRRTPPSATCFIPHDERASAATPSSRDQ